MNSNKTCGNLFTDIYTVRESLYDEDADKRIDIIKKEVNCAIRDDSQQLNLRYVLLKTTNLCNSKCEYCQHAINRISPEMKVSMPNETIMKLLDEAKELGVHAIALSGGEPLMRKDIECIISKACENRIVPVLLTNGLLLGEKIEALLKAGLRYIMISLDSINGDIYEKQRGVKIDKVIEGIKRAVELRAKVTDLEIYVSTVLTEDNHRDFLELLDEMNSLGVKVQISPYHKRWDDQDDFSIKKYEEIKKLVEELIEKKQKGYKIANSVGFLEHLPDFFCKEKIIPDGFNCKAGYTTLAVDAYMNVKPCWSYMFEPLGNIQKDTLKSIWNGEKIKHYREKMMKCECEGCWYLCTSEVCMMLEDKIYG